ncbi:YcnI family copper-binding membrane protein [Nocardia nova]|uniref:YcnI family copper-binding membrane protein n=1 Tax=Nocardia nova TaxID=37330 RepID=UPI0033E18A64
MAVAVPLVALAAPAAAHVQSDGTPVTKGGYGLVHLIVPGESATANTVGLTVTIPAGVDLKSARTQPVPGWKASVERDQATARVTRIVWTADTPADGFGNTEYREFSFSAGPWPKNVDSVALPADQRYSDGSVVSWNEIAVDKASEPEHPAPVVPVTATAAGHSDDSAHAVSAKTSAAGHDDAALHDGSESSPSRWWQALSVVALVLAVAAATLALRRDRGSRS